MKVTSKYCIRKNGNTLMSDKVIITDCDGVLLDWLHSFRQWMKVKGHEVVNPDQYRIFQHFDIEKKLGYQLVATFNESANMAFLSPYKDAIKYVRKLHEEHGYVFHVVTSQSGNRHAQNLRIQNLEDVFGKGVFEEITILDTGADKDKALDKYKNSCCYWVEDKPDNAEVGHRLGLESILMLHEHNKDYTHSDIKTVDTWKDVYNIIIGE